MATTGIAFLLKFYNGVTYDSLGGQRNATLNMNVSEVDTTSKDSSGWHEGLPSTRDWSIDFDALLLETDTAFGNLEDMYLNNTQLLIEFATAGGSTYAGNVTLSNITQDTPFDGEAVISGSLVGDGAMTKT